MDQVDEADLIGLLEDEQTEENPAVCTCAEKCQAGAVNTACLVCAVDMSECAWKAPEVELEPEKGSGSGGALVLILMLTALGGGGAFAYIKFIKPKQGAKVSTDTDNYEFEDEEYEDGTIQFFIISDSTISISSSVLLAERLPDTHTWTNWAIASIIW